MTQTLCPLCNVVLDNVEECEDNYPWVRCQCGMLHRIYSGDYKRHIGNYLVRWSLYPLPEQSRIYDTRFVWDELVWKGHLLPFDVSEDMIKIVLTFQ